MYSRRAKEKRLKKDAGRTRWSQYFRSMKGGSSPRSDKLLDKDDLKVDLDSNFSHHGTHCLIFCKNIYPSHNPHKFYLNLSYFFEIPDLNSDDSYGTVVNMGMDGDGSSPHGSSRGASGFLHGSNSPAYLSGHASPSSHHPFPYPDQLAVYNSLGKTSSELDLSKHKTNKSFTNSCVRSICLGLS